MKKISQGKYELFTTKADAIDKFMQMQGFCREETSEEKPIKFYCQKNGEIIVSNPPTKHIENDNSTDLYAQIVEQDGKTYVSYYTAFSKTTNVLKIIFLVIDLLMAVFAIIGIIISNVKTYYLPILAFCLIFLGVKLFTSTKEEKNSPEDSEILIKELEKRVEAVNLWDK